MRHLVPTVWATASVSNGGYLHNSQADVRGAMGQLESLQIRKANNVNEIISAPKGEM